jgi:hypothetical protein
MQFLAGIKIWNSRQFFHKSISGLFSGIVMARFSLNPIPIWSHYIQ